MQPTVQLPPGVPPSVPHPPHAFAAVLVHETVLPPSHSSTPHAPAPASQLSPGAPPVIPPQAPHALRPGSSQPVLLGPAHSYDPQVPQGAPRGLPLRAPQPLHAFVPVWHDVPSQHPPLQVSPPAQLVPQTLAVQAWALGQSPGAAQPHVPDDWQKWPAVDVEQSVHAPPSAPHDALSAFPVTHVPADEQHPPLQLTPELHPAPHVWATGSHAWFAGQSVDVAQPQLPWTQWLEPVQAPHAAPIVPHSVSVVLVTHVPVVSQHPLGQVAAVHLSAH